MPSGSSPRAERIVAHEGGRVLSALPDAVGEEARAAEVDGDVAGDARDDGRVGPSAHERAVVALVEAAQPEHDAGAAATEAVEVLELPPGRVAELHFGASDERVRGRIRVPVRAHHGARQRRERRSDAVAGPGPKAEPVGLPLELDAAIEVLLEVAREQRSLDGELTTARHEILLKPRRSELPDPQRQAVAEVLLDPRVLDEEVGRVDRERDVRTAPERGLDLVGPTRIDDVPLEGESRASQLEPVLGPLVAGMVERVAELDLPREAERVVAVGALQEEALAGLVAREGRVGPEVRAGLRVGKDVGDHAADLRGPLLAQPLFAVGALELVHPRGQAFDGRLELGDLVGACRGLGGELVRGGGAAAGREQRGDRGEPETSAQSSLTHERCSGWGVFDAGGVRARLGFAAEAKVREGTPRIIPCREPCGDRIGEIVTSWREIARGRACHGHRRAPCRRGPSSKSTPRRSRGGPSRIRDESPPLRRMPTERLASRPRSGL
ncbi:MAG: hypothetical protein RJA16_1840 [Planctomycetota bacterium]